MQLFLSKNASELRKPISLVLEEYSGKIWSLGNSLYSYFLLRISPAGKIVE